METLGWLSSVDEDASNEQKAAETNMTTKNPLCMSLDNSKFIPKTCTELIKRQLVWIYLQQS